MPVDAKAQALALGAAAGFDHQEGGGGGVVFVFRKAANFDQLIAGEDLGFVAVFAGFAGGGHVLGNDGILVVVEHHGAAGLPGIRDLAGDEHMQAVAAHVAVFAGDVGVRRVEVGDVLGRHGVAGEAAKRGGVGFFPGVVGAGKEHQHEQDDGEQGQDARERFRIGWGQKEIANGSEEFLHGTPSGKIWLQRLKIGLQRYYNYGIMSSISAHILLNQKKKAPRAICPGCFGVVQITRRSDLRPGHTGDITAQIHDRVVQRLGHILEVVDERARILLVVLVVVSGLEQARRPGVVANGGALSVLVRFAVAVRIHKEVRIGVRVIDCANAGFNGLSLNGGIQLFGHAFQLALEAFGHVAVTVVIRGRSHADGGRIIGAVAAGAGSGLGGQSMRVVAGGAGIEVGRVSELRGVFLALVLVDTLGI